MVDFLLSLVLDGAIYLWGAFDAKWYWKVLVAAGILIAGMLLCGMVFSG